MLRIVVPETELWDETRQEFLYVNHQILQLEHSLVSISKWEAKWHKGFFSKREKSLQETIDYIRCMTLTQNVKTEVYSALSDENLIQIHDYLNDPMTATYFSQIEEGANRSETVTSELIYYWMIALNIPPEYQKWHINRLLTLIRVCNVKNAPPKKMSKRSIMRRNAALNEERKRKWNTRG